jgi:hypothetical protein
MTFEEWFFNYYGRGKAGVVPSGPIPPGYDPNQAINADLGRFGKRTSDFFERTFGAKAGPKLGEPLPGERPALQMPGLTRKLGEARDFMNRESGNATIPLPGYRQNPNYQPPYSPKPNFREDMSYLGNAIGNMFQRQPQPAALPAPPYQQPLVGVPYPGVPMPMPLRKEVQMPIGPRSSGEPRPVYHVPESEEPLPEPEPPPEFTPEVEEAIPPLLRRPWGNDI